MKNEQEEPHIRCLKDERRLLQLCSHHDRRGRTQTPFPESVVRQGRG